jgi:glycosyltransferase involved in cell wall biosynthesis
MSANNFCSLESLPTVTIAIPTYNEANSIKKVITTFLNNTYSQIVEILIADGGSIDKTQDIVKQLSLTDSRIKLIVNPQKIQAAALNLMLCQAQGDIFLRADAHCEYALNYVEKCVEALLKSKAINVGGAQRFVATQTFQSGIALASKSLLGNGGAKYRNINYNGYADTVFLGCFWKKDLLNFSGYACQDTNEDAELNLRLIKTNPESIYISSEIKVWYDPRKNWNSLFRQYFKYGRGRCLTSLKHPNNLQLRGKLSFLIILNILILLLLDYLFSNINLPIQQCIITIIFLPFLESGRVTWKYQNNFITEIWRGKPNEIPSLLSLWLCCTLVIFTLPIAHFLGYGYQLFRYKLLRVKEW